ncbi:hypothetical protein HETIRDRAFT_477650 [Heterobasidion irregulare TC 32-1]|uniref:Peptidase C14 caspase domain-containing protein n=1 Tax=Heterobasidion irregulare (strain TC 32-1) TaxID=747525 RepID=W4K2M3_HETIT|nr:uncharacterized protein HETIRDRAFT_477650 [Heterobasidion irregulare TC 32-1]ETW80067.1 hypothetical protein HETIRDRAFT_477650 [Heterobasidion irregulare TC 32-1]
MSQNPSMSDTGPPTIISPSGKSLHPSQARSRIFALVVGINKYQHPGNFDLAGCVNDAKSMVTFLRDRLQVPEDHIAFLSDESATRKNIISTFSNHLTHNEEILEGDAMIMYYAGHGSRVPAPEGWQASDGQIETICPHDEGMQTADGQVITGIPDRTVNTLLRELATKKGNNISVIFDSCHSGGITRNLSVPRPSLRPRFLPNARPLHPDTDSAIWSSGIWTGDAARGFNQKIPSGFRYEAMSSHILLAACRQEEQAFEDLGSAHSVGLFTSILLKKLQNVAKDCTTYRGLFDQVNAAMVEYFDKDTDIQHPQCEGNNKDRVFLDGKSVDGDIKTFNLVDRSGGTYRIDAGSVLGVAPGSEFIVEVRAGESLARKKLGILVAQEVSALSSVLSRRSGDLHFDIPTSATAFFSNFAHRDSILNVFFNGEQGLLSHPADSPTGTRRGRWSTGCTFIQVFTPAEADVIVTQKPDGFTFERRDPLILNYADPTVSIKFPQDRLPTALNAIAHFKYHLGRHHNSDALQTVSGLSEDGGVKMEIYRLKPQSICVLIPGGDNLLTNNHARLVFEKDAEYGIAIVNESTTALFPYLFYFDPSEYSIKSLYLPPASSMAAPLQPGQSVTVGYGAGGGDPIDFYLPDDAVSDTGFLKLFVSPTYVDMEWMIQDESFRTTSTRGTRSQGFENEGWGAWIAAVTVTAPGQAGNHSAQHINV